MSWTIKRNNNQKYWFDVYRNNHFMFKLHHDDIFDIFQALEDWKKKYD